MFDSLGQNAFSLIQDLLFWGVLAIYIWRVGGDLWKKSIYGIIGNTLLFGFALFVINDPQQIGEWTDKIWNFLLGRA